MTEYKQTTCAKHGLVYARVYVINGSKTESPCPWCENVASRQKKQQEAGRRIMDKIRGYELSFPWPPTINTYWRHVGPRVLISRAGRAYRTTVGQIVAPRGLQSLRDARLAVVIDAYPPDRRRRDLDNILKCLLDSMQHAGLYDDDSQIDDMRISRGMTQNPGRVDVFIEVIK